MHLRVPASVKGQKGAILICWTDAAERVMMSVREAGTNCVMLSLLFARGDPGGSEVADGKADKENNLLKNAPHPMMTRFISDKWNAPYTRDLEREGCLPFKLRPL